MNSDIFSQSVRWSLCIMYKRQYLPSTNKHLLNVYYDKQVPFKELHIKTVYRSDLMTIMIMLIMMTTVATKMTIMSQSSTVLAFQ
jgi:hypothetical protein